MIKVLSIDIEDMDNAGCNNGNYPEFLMKYSDNGKISSFEGLTCACRKGCSGTMRVPEVGDTFKDEEALFEYMKN
jgi:hypothetical protein